MMNNLINIVNRVVGSKLITESTINTSFTELGVDSLALIQIIVEIEKEFGIAFPDEKLVMNEIDTIEKIYGIICSIKNGKDD